MSLTLLSSWEPTWDRGALTSICLLQALSRLMMDKQQNATGNPKSKPVTVRALDLPCLLFFYISLHDCIK